MIWKKILNLQKKENKMKIEIEKKPRGWNLSIDNGTAKNYSSLFKLAKALMNFAKGQGI